MKRIGITIAMVLSLALAGCGTTAAEPKAARPGAVPEQKANVQTYTEGDFNTALKLEYPKFDNDLPADLQPGPSDPETGCLVSVYLTTPGEIETYAGAGDPVATNPARTVGVKYNNYEGADPSVCYDTFTARLKALK